MFGGFFRRFGVSVRNLFRRASRTIRSADQATGIPANSGDIAGALQASAVWACCRVISCSVGSLPGRVFEETLAGKVRAEKHPLWRLLTIQPNPLMTLSQWVQTSVLHLLLYGNAYTVPQYEDGEAVALWPIPPDRVAIKSAPDGTYSYRVTHASGEQKDYLPSELLHFRIFSLDGVIGLSPIEYHRLTFEIDAASRVFAVNLYANGGRPSGVLSYPSRLREEQIVNIRSSWKQVHGGTTGVGSICILENGAKYESIAIPPEQLQFIAQQKFSVETIARIFGVPPHLIGAMDKPTYASVEQQALEFLQYTLQPIVTSLEKTIQSVLLEEPLFYKFNIASFERSDIKTRYAAYATGRQWGWLSVNDIRELEDMNRIGDEGDIYLQPLNMIQAGTTLNAFEPNAPAPQ
jgi:HK97 family phage portal protein